MGTNSNTTLTTWSHPMRVRGLKSKKADEEFEGWVAPHAGAWIEMVHEDTDDFMRRLVAPHAGAWIEIWQGLMITCYGIVAPHAGAWIEIACEPMTDKRSLRRTPCGCVD